MKFSEAIAAQGENLRVSRTHVTEALRGTDLQRFRTGRLLLTGMGASLHALEAAYDVLLVQGRPVTCLGADMLTAVVGRSHDSLVAVSQIGTSIETIEAVNRRDDVPCLVVTNAPESPLAALADAVVPLGLLGDSPVYTLGYTGTLQALGLLVEALGTGTSSATWDEMPARVEGCLEEAASLISRLVERIGTPRAVDFVGSGAHLAAAREGSLLGREASRLPTSSHSTRQYLHGPMEPLDNQQLAVIIGDGREITLAADVAQTGAHVLLITTADPHPQPGITVVRLPRLTPIELAVLEILPIQLLVEQTARRQGLTVEGFRYEQSDTKARDPTTRHRVGEAGRSRRGALGIDLGGSKLAVALVADLRGETLFFDTCPTPSGATAVLDAAADLVRSATAAAKELDVQVLGVGIGVPELVDRDGHIVSNAVLPELDDNELIKRFSVVAPTVVESDVRVAALAEARCGAGRKYRSFCYISVGTGISYSYVENGLVLAGARGVAISLGSAVTAEWEVAGERRCWVLEEIASGPGVLARYLGLGGTRHTPAEVLASYGDEEAATQAVDETSRALGIGVSLSVDLLDPEAVVVGGGLGTAGGAFWDRMIESAREHIYADVARDVPIVQAELGPRSAAVGAALVGWGGSNALRHRPMS